jgi:hypothetical protein
LTKTTRKLVTLVKVFKENVEVDGENQIYYNKL